MLSISESIRQYYLPALYLATYPNPKIGMNTWLTLGEGYFVSQTKPPGEFAIGTYQSSAFLSSYTFDINRLSCASFESVHDIKNSSVDSSSFGWQLIKLYYSAFFSAHCILRLVNRGVANVDGKSIIKVQQIANLYSYSLAGMNSGSYCMTLDTINNNFIFSKKTSYSDSHVGLWLKFLHFLEEVIKDQTKTSIINFVPSGDAQNTIAKLEELKEAISNHGLNGSWLSKIRNSVNYSQEYGTWYPYKELTRERDAVFNQPDFYTKNPFEIMLKADKGREILYFIKACQLIVCICYDALNDIYIRNEDNKSFVKAGLMKYLNHIS
jgi:hypothetical protein